MTQLVLSLFPGIGLLDRAFEEEGFCIVRGPDLLWGGDIKSFHPPAGKFDGVIGGPPCTRYSQLQRINVARGKALPEDLIPEFRRCVRACAADWFLMENVSAAPRPGIEGYFEVSRLINNAWLGEAQNRVRRFTFGARRRLPFDLDFPALHALDAGSEVCVTRRATKWENRPGRRPRPRSTISWEHVRQSLKLQGQPQDLFERFQPRLFTVEGAQAVTGNGVPHALGLAVAKAVKRALNLPDQKEDAA